MDAIMTCYFNNGRIYRRENVKGIMFTNGTLVVDIVDEKGDIQVLKYTRDSLKDGNVLTIY